MSGECHIRGCRNLQTTCIDCGRVVCTKTLPKPNEWINCKDLLPKISYLESDNSDDPYESYPVLLQSNCRSYCVGYLVMEQDENNWNFKELSWELHIPGESGHIISVDFDVFTHWMPLMPPTKE